MKNIIPFLCYVINPRKFKSVLILAQCFVLSLLVGCRAQMHTDELRYEAQTAELIRRLGRDCPVPAYVVPNPNCCYGNPVGIGYGYNGGNGCGCGC